MCQLIFIILVRPVRPILTAFDADRLVLGLHTVQAHLGHIFNKLQVGSRTGAVVYALRKGWVALDGLLAQDGTTRKTRMSVRCRT